MNSRERKQEFEINGQEAAPPQMNHDSEAPGLLEGQHLDIFLLQAVIEEWVGGGFVSFTKPDLLKSEVKGIMSWGMVSNSCTLQ